jgi:hypothetical protein
MSRFSWHFPEVVLFARLYKDWNFDDQRAGRLLLGSFDDAFQFKSCGGVRQDTMGGADPARCLRRFVHHDFY